MYNALDQDMLRQQLRDRDARSHYQPAKDKARQHRRWWRKAAHVGR